MRVYDILRAWRKVPQQAVPALAVEITRKCPMGCSRCDANAQVHLGHATTLHGLEDMPADDLVFGVLAAVDRIKAQHVLLTGGEPLIRHRELKRLVPLLLARGVKVQLATTAIRSFPLAWTLDPNMTVVVNVDGLQPEHDRKRAPATYKRILSNVSDRQVTIHCTLTGHMLKRPLYLKEFLDFWTSRPETRKIWFSLFTPQKGQQPPEALTPEQRKAAISEMMLLQPRYPKLDMSRALITQLSSPPKNPAQCVLARTTTTLSADIKTQILPCPFGGDPDCPSCGYFAAMRAATNRQGLFAEKLA
jgi:organic radical activating enzyme